MQTPIGIGLRESRWRLATAALLGSGVVAADLIVAWRSGLWILRPLLACTALIAFVILVRGDLGALGLRQPRQGLRFWVKTTLIIGSSVAVFILVAFAILTLMGTEIPVYTTSPSQLGARFVSACIEAPILEELTYRLVLCVPAAALLGATGSITVSGVAFGGLHFAYGNPSPENLVGGFFLAWTYLKSGSIAVPMALHSLGNLVVLSGQVAAWYWVR